MSVEVWNERAWNARLDMLNVACELGLVDDTLVITVQTRRKRGSFPRKGGGTCVKMERNLLNAIFHSLPKLGPSSGAADAKAGRRARRATERMMLIEIVKNVGGRSARD